MNTLLIGDKKYLAVSSWKESRAEHLLFFCLLQTKKYSRDKILERFAYRFTGAGARTYFQMNKLQRRQWEGMFDWIFTDQLPARNFFPQVRVRWEVFAGPGDGLDNVLVEEWMIADPAARHYLKSSDEKSLNRMIACMYRPLVKERKSMDPRIAFNEYDCERRIKHVARMPRHLKQALLLNYIGMRRQMQEDFPNVFRGKSSGTNFGIPGMIHDMSGPELGTVQEIQQSWTIRNLLFVAEKNERTRLEQKKN